MQRGPMPIDRLEIGLWRGDLDIVFDRCVEGTATSDPEINAAGLDQGFDCRLNQPWRRWRRGRCDFVRQAITLVCVKDREAFQEWNRLRLFAVFDRTTFLVLWHKAVGVNDGGAALTLADMAAKRQRLAKRKPALSGKTVFDHGSPKDQDVDAAVLPVGRSVLWHCQRRLCRGRPPGLDPGHAASLEFSDDLAGDFVIEARPALAGARLRIVFGHRGSPRRAPRAFLATIYPSRKRRPSSHSTEVDPRKGTLDASLKPSRAIFGRKPAGKEAAAGASA